MGHKIRIDLPQPKSNHIPTWTHTQNLKVLHKKYKSMQEKYYNSRHRVKTLPSLPDSTPIWIQTKNTQVAGTVVLISI